MFGEATGEAVRPARSSPSSREDRSADEQAEALLRAGDCLGLLAKRVWVSPQHVLRSFLRSLLGIAPILDLHGLKVSDALAATERFLREAHEQGEREVRIVYGKGRGTPGGIGVLRQAVPAWIEQHAGDWVERFERQLDDTGDDGAMRIWIRPRTPLGEPGAGT